MEYLASLPWYLNKIVSETNFSEVTDCKVNFHWGDNRELNKYLHVDQDSKFGSLLSGVVENQFPLIWLVKGYTFKNEDVSEKSYLFEDIKIVFLRKTNMEWTNKTRWKDSMHSLYGLGHLFKDQLKRDRSSNVISNMFKWKEDDKASLKEITGNSSSTVEYCDALVLKINSLRIDTSCFKYSEHLC